MLPPAPKVQVEVWKHFASIELQQKRSYEATKRPRANKTIQDTWIFGGFYTELTPESPKVKLFKF